MEVILVCGALLSLLVACLFQYYLVSTTRKLPPGRTGWPVIGESIEFFRYFQKLDAEKFFFKRMEKYSPRVFKTSILGDHYAVLCGAEGSKFLFSNSNKLVGRYNTRTIRKLFITPEIVASLDTHMKPALLRFLKSNDFTNSVGVMDTLAQRHVQSWQSQEITMYPLVKNYLLALAVRLFMSIDDPKLVEKLYDPMEMLAAGMIAMPIDLPGTQMNRSIKAAAELKLHICSIVKHQRSVMESNSSGSAKDLLGYLMQELDKDELVAECIVAAIVGGYETSSSVVCMTLKVLTDYPQLYQKVYQENMEVAATKKPGDMLNREDTQKMRYTWNVVREVMRIYPVGPFVTREANADFTFADFNIPKGYKLIASIDALHKDPEYFKDPEEFDPSRFDGNGPLPYTYIPFGGGFYMCPGVTYAQLAMLIFIHNVVKKYKWKSLIPDEKIDGIPHPKPAQGLPLRLYPHEN